MSLTEPERRAVLLIAAVQFVNILDFIMVMPLGPDFAAALDVPASHVGYVGGSYTAAASVAGLLGSLFLDRFDRRSALAVAVGGLVMATALGGLAVNLETLLAARVLAGVFGGPAVALGTAIIADRVAPERRGRAMGIAMGSFSVAAVLGVPVGLELARLGSWRLPFFVVAALGVVVASAAMALLPPQRDHLEHGPGPDPFARLRSLLSRRAAWLAYGTAGLLQMQAFMIIPNISAYVQGNLGFPRGKLGLLYLIGGTLTFFGMRVAGRLSDRFGSATVTLANTALISVVVWAAFVDYQPWMPLLVLFPVFMVTNGMRIVANGAAFSKVPQPHERAGFMALVSAVQHIAAALGAFVSAYFLDTAPDGQLLNMASVATGAIALGLAVPPMMFALERAVRPAPAMPWQPPVE
ncbi:MFS transporter [Azospirillum sp. TSO22-1]|uniref:MFS transporter n=1 Tax=Azospirillum sp. TSO22-1 TaxID=716789 RepID=UPI000D609DAD|nr:MFS transporter [Azospirillum sp. TSO22-1]PWC54187.1 MFS transporter [Azospirillum sp. TSO22-1]